MKMDTEHIPQENGYVSMPINKVTQLSLVPGVFLIPAFSVTGYDLTIWSTTHSQSAS